MIIRFSAFFNVLFHPIELINYLTSDYALKLFRFVNYLVEFRMIRVFAYGIIASFLLLIEIPFSVGAGFDIIEDQTDEQDELIYALNAHFNDLGTFHSKGYKVVVAQESNAVISKDGSLATQSMGALVSKGCFHGLACARKLGVCTALFNKNNLGLGSYYLTAAVPSSPSTKPGPDPNVFSVFNTSASIYRTLDCSGTPMRERVYRYFPFCHLYKLSNQTEYNWEWTVVSEMPDIPPALDYGILVK